jgi:hypothetical protein
MQKVFKIKVKKSVSLFLGIVVLLFLLFPDAAHAFECGVSSGGQKGNIFNILACKITTTLADVRKIVYIIGGFGLIAFTFAAIFNKISFKHLGTIALSLFLLSMMTPFIEYFTQAPGQHLQYGYYLEPSFTANDYSTTFGECGDKCHPGSEDSDSDSSNALGGIGKLESIAPLDIQSMDPNSVKLDLNTIKSAAETVQDTRTKWQKTKDTIKNVVNEGIIVYNTGSAIISGAKNIKNAIGNVNDTIGNISNIQGVFSAGQTIATDMQNVTGSAKNVADVVGTNYTDKEGKKSAGETVRDKLAGIDNVASETREVSGDAAQGADVAAGINGWRDDLKNF